METILGLTIIATVCGVKSWEQIAYFGELRQQELSSLIDFTNGVPSHDTLERVYGMIDPASFHSCFVSWTQSLHKDSSSLVSIDGKVCRSSGDSLTNQEPLYLVNAWANKNKLILGQFKTAGKGHEIMGIKSLLEMLTVKGSIISIDAIGCQHDIAQKIIEKEADYILAVKDNQPTLKDDIISSFSTIKSDSEHTDVDKTGGRVETRSCSVITNLKMITSHTQWEGIKSVIKIESTRWINQEESYQSRYYISSLECSAKEFNELIRSHWGIENSLHWTLDVNFGEDDSRKRKGYSAQNFSLTNKIAINLLNQEIDSKLSMTHKRLRANYDFKFLKKILNFDA